MILAKVLGWGAGVVIIALLGCVAALHIENAGLETELTTAKSDLATANANKVTLQSSIDEQNRRLRNLENQTDDMKKLQVAAITEADMMTSEYETRIAEIRRSKATTAEEVRIKMLKFAGVHL